MRWYLPHLRLPARRLRREMTPGERILWTRLRRKQVLGIPFYRQRPLGRFIVDFYASAVRLVIEIDGGVHDGSAARARDAERDRMLNEAGLRVIRFRNCEVENNIDGVVRRIIEVVRNPPSVPPFAKGG